MAKTKKNYIYKNKNTIFNLFLLFVLFLALALIIPAIGASSSSPALWIGIVDFFESVQTHFKQDWMFYSFAALVLLAYFGSKKK